jgi:hypothetical protein
MLISLQSSSLLNVVAVIGDESAMVWSRIRLVGRPAYMHIDLNISIAPYGTTTSQLEHQEIMQTLIETVAII